MIIKARPLKDIGYGRMDRSRDDERILNIGALLPGPALTQQISTYLVWGKAGTPLSTHFSSLAFIFWYTDSHFVVAHINTCAI